MTATASKSRSRGRGGLLGLLGLAGALGLWLGLRSEAKAEQPTNPEDKPDEPKTPEQPEQPQKPDEPEKDEPSPWKRRIPKRPKQPKPEPVEPEPEEPEPVEPEPEEPEEPEEPGQWTGRLRRPPFSKLLRVYPGGSGFYQVIQGERFGGEDSRGIAYRYLLNEGYAAATEHGGLEHEAAIEWARTVAKRNSVRLAVIDLIQGSGWNDLMYGAEPQAGTRVTPGTGRSILLLPQHAPVKDQLANGLQPQRNARLSNGQGVDPDFRDYELLWLPGIDRKALWESGGTEISTLRVWWPDGSTKENPPPWVMRLGVDDISGATNVVTTWGSDSGDGQIEVT